GTMTDNGPLTANGPMTDNGPMTANGHLTANGPLTDNGPLTRPAGAYPARMLHRMPAAMAEPMTPATLGAIACMSRKLFGSSCWPTCWTTRAESGTAETPAAPISGLILSFRKRFIPFAARTPQAVATAKLSA